MKTGIWYFLIDVLLTTVIILLEPDEPGKFGKIEKKSAVEFKCAYNRESSLIWERIIKKKNIVCFAETRH